MSMEGISQTSAYQGGSLASQAHIQANNVVVQLMIFGTNSRIFHL